MATLTELKPNRKSEPMIRPSGGGILEKAAVVGGGLVVVYTFAATLPIASAAALVGIAAYCWDEVKKFQSRETSEQLEAILSASTPKHPSINEVRAELKRLYPVAAINRAIESMVGHCEPVYFKPGDKHPLAAFGECYCWIDPDDPKNVMLPLQRLEQLFTAWELLPTVTTAATPATPHQGQELASNPPAMATPATPSGSSAAAAELLARLKVEVPELLRLVKAPPIRLVGLQRTGKSTFAARLALLRMVLLPGHTAAWATPHRELDNPVPSVLNPTGYTATGAKDYAAIEALWTATQDRIDQGQALNQTVVWDEFGGYDQFQDGELLKGSLRSMLREASKFSYHPIIIAHGDQGAFYPGIANIVTTVRNSTVKVETHGEPADHFGTMRPTGKVTITWLDGTTTGLAWPAWLTTDFLLSCLQEPPGAPPGQPQSQPIVSAPMSVEATLDPLPVLPESDPIRERVREKLTAKLEENRGEWFNIRELTANLFRQPQDREILIEVIREMINAYTVETMEKENANKTVSYFIRLPSSNSATNKVDDCGTAGTDGEK